MTDLITTPFGFRTTSSEVTGGVDLQGRNAVVTGASSGIGVETARALAHAGAKITLAVRDLDAGARAADMIRDTTGGSVLVEWLDLGDLTSVAAFVRRWSKPVYILVNNAGVMAVPELRLTADGWESQFGVNHLGHFALTYGLHSALASAGGARVVSLSSVGHVMSPVVFDDINFAERPYDPWAAYGQAKTANALFVVAAARRWASDGIAVNAVHPGAIAETNLSRHMSPETTRAMQSADPGSFKTIEQGAATSVLVAASPLLDGVTGRYFENCNEAVPLEGSPAEVRTARRGVAEHARDPELARRLWDLSLAAIVDALPGELEVDR